MPITIRTRDNGPFVISVEDAPNVWIEDPSGNVVEPTPGKNIPVCRCGASTKRPSFNGSHKSMRCNGPAMPKPADRVAGAPAAAAQLVEG